MEIYKAVTPDAFDEKMQTDAATVFIDLQLKLQCPDGIEDLQKNCECLVGRTISRFLECPSVVTVIALYDDYTPDTKSEKFEGPTQIGENQGRRSKPGRHTNHFQP